MAQDEETIVSLQTTWTIDEAVRIALKAEETIQKQGIDSSKNKTKSDTNQSSSSHSGGIKCYRCQEVGHTSNQCRATKRVNLVEGDKAHSEFKDEGLIISPIVVFEDDDDHSEAFLGLVRRLVLTSTKKSEDSQRHNILNTVQDQPRCVQR
ncbi:RNA-directed DNA polymerase, partial [Tanacetum coccineum]